MQYIRVKKESKNMHIIIPALISGIVLYLLKGTSCIYDLVFCIFILLFTNKKEEESINYAAYKSSARKMIYLMVAMGIFLPLADVKLSSAVLKFYILFLVLVTILLREVRAYSYNITNKRTMMANIGIIITTSILSTDIIFSFVEKIVFLILKGVGTVLDFLLTIILRVLDKPLGYLGSFVFNLAAKLLKSEKNTNADDVTTPALQNINLKEFKGLQMPLWLKFSLEFLIFIIILYVIFKCYRITRKGDDGLDNSFTEEREKILKEKTVKENSIIQRIANLFRTNDSKTQIFNVYRKFEQRANTKNIFKPYFTASQLKGVSKAYVNDGKSLDSITEIYNEAKFSSHEINTSMVQNIKQDYENIKKEI